MGLTIVVTNGLLLNFDRYRKKRRLRPHHNNRAGSLQFMTLSLEVSSVFFFFHSSSKKNLR